MAHAGICNVDCKLEIDADGNRSHIMYAAEPSSAAGRYQWELNRAILDRGRRAWRESGQGQSKACREWDYMRSLGYRIGIRSHRRWMAALGYPWSNEHAIAQYALRDSE